MKIWNKLIYLLFILSLFAPFNGCVTNSDEKGNKDNTVYPHKFHIEGNIIADESGKEIIFRGTL